MKTLGGEFYELARHQFNLMMSNKFNYCEILVNCYCPRHFLVMAYQRLVRLRKIGAVEDMYQQDKESAWEMAKDIAKGRLRKDQLIELVKAMLAIEYFLNVQIN